MPFNLSFPGLLPSTPYSVSVDMLIGDELIDTLRSFSVTTPPILTSNIKSSMPTNVSVSSVWRITREFEAEIPQTTENTSATISQVKAHLKRQDSSGRVAKDWTGSKNNLKASESPNEYAPVIVFTMTLSTSQQGVQISNVIPYSGVDGVPEVFGALKSEGYLTTGADNKFSFEVPASNPILNMKFIRNNANKKKSYWKGNLQSAFFKVRSGVARDVNYKKTRGFLPYTAFVEGIKTIPKVDAKPEIGYVIDTLSASAAPEIYGELQRSLESGGPTVRYSIHFLYCDSASNEAPPDTDFIYLDGNFKPAVGADSDPGVVNYTPARSTTPEPSPGVSGGRFKAGGRTHLPYQASPGESATAILSNTLPDTIIFNNDDVSTEGRDGETRANLRKPNQVWIAFTAVRHDFQNGTWTRAFAYTDDNTGQGLMSSPFKLGVQ
jgi:hypothetical protein